MIQLRKLLVRSRALVDCSRVRRVLLYRHRRIVFSGSVSAFPHNIYRCVIIPLPLLLVLLTLGLTVLIGHGLTLRAGHPVTALCSSLPSADIVYFTQAFVSRVYISNILSILQTLLRALCCRIFEGRYACTSV
jgi:hypothetical protein